MESRTVHLEMMNCHLSAVSLNNENQLLFLEFSAFAYYFYVGVSLDFHGVQNFPYFAYNSDFDWD